MSKHTENTIEALVALYVQKPQAYTSKEVSAFMKAEVDFPDVSPQQVGRALGDVFKLEGWVRVVCCDAYRYEANKQYPTLGGRERRLQDWKITPEHICKMVREQQAEIAASIEHARNGLHDRDRLERAYRLRGSHS